MTDITRNLAKIDFKAAPGYLLAEPLEKETRSSMMDIPDQLDKPYKGYVVSVGDTKITDFGTKLESPVKEGDLILYSIAGCEETKMVAQVWDNSKKEYRENLNQRFTIVPFGRVLAIKK